MTCVDPDATLAIRSFPNSNSTRTVDSLVQLRHAALAVLESLQPLESHTCIIGSPSHCVSISEEMASNLVELSLGSDSGLSLSSSSTSHSFTLQYPYDDEHWADTARERMRVQGAVQTYVTLIDKMFSTRDASTAGHDCKFADQAAEELGGVGGRATRLDDPPRARNALPGWAQLASTSVRGE